MRRRKGPNRSKGCQIYSVPFCSDRQGSPRGPLKTVPARRTSRVDSSSAQDHPQTPSTPRDRVPNVRGVLVGTRARRRLDTHFKPGPS